MYQPMKPRGNKPAEDFSLPSVTWSAEFSNHEFNNINLNPKKKKTFSKIYFGIYLMIFIIFNAPVMAQDQKEIEIYGFVMMDAGYNFNQSHPDWFDVIRPTKLPSFENEFGTDGNIYYSVRQTRLGFKTSFPTELGELKTHFEYEMFGTGADAGQTTFRLRHAYAELGKFGVGQYWSPFMDIDIFPNSVEYWGPNGMVLFRNVQFRYMPIQGETRLTFALERPGRSADQGVYEGRIELENVEGRFPLPDLSAEYRQALPFGYVELAGMLRRIEWEDLNDDDFELSGGATGWGLNMSTNINFGERDVFRGGLVFGEGIQNYMNDAPVDIGIRNNFSDPVSPVEGVALPMIGISAFLDHTWSDKFSTSVGYSMLDIENSDAQTDDSYKKGQYALVNLLYYPAENFLAGIEYQWGSRENFRDGWNTSISRVQFSFKYNFSHSF
jgi:hypothetical protein